MLYKIARTFEFLAFVLEDIAERIDEEAAKDEVGKQLLIMRNSLSRKGD